LLSRMRYFKIKTIPAFLMEAKGWVIKTAKEKEDELKPFENPVVGDIAELIE